MVVDGVMKKIEMKNKIKEIVSFLTDGVVEINNQVFKGHPCFYLLHSKEDFANKLDEIIADKKKFNEFDLCYYLNYMFKYMLHPYDSHTGAFIKKDKFLPLKIKIIDGNVYIIDCNENLNCFKGQIIKQINGINIEIIISELEKIISYYSKNYLNLMLEKYLVRVNILKSLPSLDITNLLIISTNNGKIEFDLNNLELYVDKVKKENYNLEVKEDIAIITYNLCQDEEKMCKLIHSLEKMKNIKGYIVDLRGNRGGNSFINGYLVRFLKGKEIITLSDEKVFSSGRMCLIDLKNIGSKIIGTPPATTISSFGNCMMRKTFDNIVVGGSATYWYYDENLKCHGIFLWP